MSKRAGPRLPDPSFLLILLPYVLLCPLPAIAQAPPISPPELFKRLAPSVFVIETLGADGSVVAMGSGVAVAANQVVTNKHVVESAISLKLRKGKKTWAAKVTHLDPNHDLCRLTAEGLNAPPVSLRVSSTLQVGERVYTIGAPQGLELTFSEGLISALREFEEGRIIQTSAAISAGSSGGGLFDQRGKLVGITTFLVKEGQNLNFALPSEWVTALDKRAVTSPPTGPNDDPQSQALVWFILAYKYGEAGDYEKAAQAYREAIRLWPGDNWSWYNLGTTYGDLGQHEQAILALREAIRLKPDFASAWHNLGVNHNRLGQNTQAVEAYREAIRLKSDYEKAWLNFGVSYLRLDRYRQAVEAFREVIRLQPDDAAAWYNLGITYSIQGDRAKVMEVYQRLKLIDAVKAEEYFTKFVLP